MRTARKVRERSSGLTRRNGRRRSSRTRPLWSRSLVYLLIVAMMMSYVYRFAEPASAAVYAPPPLINEGTLTFGKYEATPEQAESIRAMENAAIASVIAVHGLDPDDGDAVLSWAREDALAELWGLVVVAIKTPAESRTTDQQNVVDWLTTAQHRQDVEAAIGAGREYVSWKGLNLEAYNNLIATGADHGALVNFLASDVYENPIGYCDYRSPSPYEEEYIGYQTQTCYTPCTSPTGCQQMPPEYDQFVKWGFARENQILDSPDLARISRGTANAIAFSAGSVAAAAIGYGIATSSTVASAFASSTAIWEAVAPFAGYVGDFTLASAQAAYSAYMASGMTAKAASEAVKADLAIAGGASTAVAAGLAVAFIIATIIITVIAIINFSVEGELPVRLADNIQTAQSTTPDLASIVNDPDKVGGLFAMFLVAALPAPRFDTCDNAEYGPTVAPCLNATEIPAYSQTDPLFSVTKAETGESFYSQTISHQLPSAEAAETTRIHGHWFINELRAIDFPPSASPSLRLFYTDWDDVNRFAWLVQDDEGTYQFVQAKQREESDPEINPSTCIDDGTCSISESINYVGDDGEQYSASVVDSGGGPHVAPTYSGARILNSPMTFNAHGVSPLGLDVTYSWQFKEPSTVIVGCGGIVACNPFGDPINGASIQQSFAKPGIWGVRLTATDSLGLVTSSEFNVMIESVEKPTLDLSVFVGATTCTPEVVCDVRSGVPQQAMEVTGLTVAPFAEDEVRLTVDWGDGSPALSVAESPMMIELGVDDIDLIPVAGSVGTYKIWSQHRYAAIGHYQVNVTVSDAAGATSLVATYVILNGVTVSWPAPDPITYGTALGDVPLSYTATDAAGQPVSGTFAVTVDGDAYDASQILPVGTHTLTVQFTPNVGNTWVPDPVSVQLEVLAQHLTITAPSYDVPDNAASLPDIAAVTYDGFASGEDVNNLNGTLSCVLQDKAGNAVALSPVPPRGVYTITCQGLTSQNYEISWVDGTLVVVDSTPPIVHPVVFGTQGRNGWYTSNVTFEWWYSDNESPITSVVGCDVFDVTTDSVGPDGVSSTCQVTSSGGVTTQVLTIKRDATAPSLNPTIAPDVILLNSEATATPNASDAASGIASQSCPTIDTSSVGEHTITCTATDVAGNSASASITYTVIDNTAPTVEATVAGTIGNDGWYTSDVTVTWTVADEDSGITSMTGCDRVVVAEDTAGTTITCTAVSAGGSTTGSVTFKRDATAPALSPTIEPTDIMLNSEASATPNADDALSGVASQHCPIVDTSSVGEHSITCTATDAAGNSATADITYLVHDPSPPVVVANVTGTLGNDDWYTSDVTITWTVTDDDSGITVMTGCDQTVINTDTAETTFTCTAASDGGSTTESVTVKRDATAPTLSPTIDPTVILFNSEATATSNATDTLSGVASQNCPSVDTASLGEHMITCTATDIAGNSATADFTYTVNDATAPSVEATLDGTLGNDGWYTSDVTITWTVTDDESGITSMTGCDQTVVTEDTAERTLTCTAVSAGGSSTKSVSVKRDATAPEVVFTGNQGTYGLLDTIVISCSVSDATSGVASDTCADLNRKASSLSAGDQSITATALDQAGNSSSTQATFRVVATHADLCGLSREILTSAREANSLCSMLAAAENAARRGQEQVAFTMMVRFQVAVSFSAMLGMMPANDAALLLRWSRAL
ncbi:MAG: hypothetical protein M9890_02160 [Thermomicrobiales bacterium]|nr:hypothetical protein [Thermomicrobiales bacterium]